ncbi:uncharacterized protein LOC133521819 isoform X1 [Cydia pomonella]|uniref:uncharacterized protein LOC133521819 isoform X1 n=1 Tax=Cydia pomonella TaxID=82600 RepID=UPI002ADD555D|nr:uncharacterized protein LOC133521819 isoform X1 [Cydia pomonella]
MLQSLLQPRDNQRLAVRHERRRNEKRGGGRRPSQLPLQLGRPGEGEPTPSPDHHRPLAEVICSKLLALHFVVGTLLLGIVIMVVGVVQLSPGAEAAQHRYYLMGTGAVLMSAGVLGCVLRCIFLHWHKKYREDHREPAHKNGVSTVEAGHDKHDKHVAHDKQVADKHVADKHVAHDKHAPAHAHDKKLKSQASVGHAEVLIKQPSAASDT